MPPARLTGPVWTASIPISENAFHMSGSAIAFKKDSFGRVINDNG
jgi:hypothetical protein